MRATKRRSCKRFPRLRYERGKNRQASIHRGVSKDSPIADLKFASAPRLIDRELRCHSRPFRGSAAGPPSFGRIRPPTLENPPFFHLAENAKTPLPASEARST